MNGGNWEFWLNVTNFALGVITFGAVAVVVSAIAWELVSRRVRRARGESRLDAEMTAMMHAVPDARLVPGLGLTMADGGEKIATSKEADSNQKPR